MEGNVIITCYTGNYNLLKFYYMITKKQLLLSVLFVMGIGYFPFISAQSQEKTVKQQDEEIKEYLDYFMKVNPNTVTTKNGNTVKLIKPEGVDPFTSFGGDAGNLKSWELYYRLKGNKMSQEGKNKKSGTRKSAIIQEKEQPGENTNDSIDKAEVIPNFGTSSSMMREVKVQGVLSEIGIDTLNVIPFVESEDNGVLSLSDSIPNLAPGEVIKVNSEFKNILKGADQELSGDIDVYNFFFEGGSKYPIKINVDGTEAFGLFALLYDENDRFLDVFSVGSELDLLFQIEQSQGFKLALLDVATFETIFLTDPDRVFPLGTEASYEILIERSDNLDKDSYQVNLKKGDVFGVSGTSEFVFGLDLFKSNADLAIGTDSYGIVPEEESPLPTEGFRGFHYVIPEDGAYILSVRSGFGTYELNFGVARPGLEEANGLSQQVIFVNMAGASISLEEFFEVDIPDDAEEVVFEPLSFFMDRWSLDSLRQTTPLASKITDIVTKKLSTELTNLGINPNTDVTIISDFGQPFLRDRILGFLDRANVPYSRLIVGGTIEGVGIRTIGLASTIDIGNFDVTNNGFILLDEISDTNPSNNLSINNVPIAEGVEKIDLVATVVGNITAHEAGHFIGNWHCNTRNDVLTIMDEGNPLISRFAGVLEDGSFGDDNTIELSFTKDQYSLVENFSGLDETDVNTSFGLTTAADINKGATLTEQSLAALEKEIMNSLFGLVSSDMISYPNPVQSSGISRLMVSPELSGYANIALYDVQGRKITEIFTGNIEAGELLELDVDFTKFNLKSGSYFYKMVSEEGEQTHSLIVK